MSRYVLTPAARGDLREIRRYIAGDSVDAAIRTVQTLRKTCRTLALRPELGRPRPELVDDPTVSVFVSAPYLIVYRPAKNPIQILRFWHGARGKLILS